MKIALLSNVNMDPVNRQLNNILNVKVYESYGYGNELEVLLNRKSPFYDFNPELTFVIIDVMELIQHDLDIINAKKKIKQWFALFENAINENNIYYLSDAYLYGLEMELVWDKDIKRRIENIWCDNLLSLVERNFNVRVFHYSRMIQKIGEENAFSIKMWYMGKILHSTTFHKELVEEIKHCMDVERRQPKKVLLLDLDNTLWRGLAGEHDITPIVLSEDGIGLAFKNFQRSILQLKKQGVILGIVSKNNEGDVLDIIENHPHMVLHLCDFAIKKINWKNKTENIVQIVNELNVGLDSIVFMDDNPVEQTLVREALPEVTVLDFPDRPEELTVFISEIYHMFFEKAVITDEDKAKTAQYQANYERKNFQESSINFEGYLDSLEMKLYRVDPNKNKDRLVQLVNKTNQFNLTTRRFTESEISKIIDDNKYEVFLYRVVDRFGDNGIVVVAIIEYGVEAVIVEFAMSCRVMGRKIEDAIIDELEKCARARGYNELIGVCKPTEKNKPVQDLYTSFGYKKRIVYDDGKSEYSMLLSTNLSRKIHIKKIDEED